MTTTELISELESDLQDTVDWEWKGLVDFNAGKTQLVCMTGQITLVLLIGVTLSLLNWIRALTLSLFLKLPPGKLES